MFTGPCTGDVPVETSGGTDTIADGDLTIAQTVGLQSALDTHTGQIIAINTSLGNLANSFYTEIEVDAFLAAKQNVLNTGTVWGGGISTAQILNGAVVRSVRHANSGPLTVTVVGESLDLSVGCYTQAQVTALLAAHQASKPRLRVGSRLHFRTDSRQRRCSKPAREPTAHNLRGE